MIEASLPGNEPQRLQSTRDTELLDTPIDQRFERITRMLARVLDVPIASFTLLDNDRLYFKSVQGLYTTEHGRRESFCGHAIHGDETMVVEDATRDERFHDNPLVTGNPNIRFYAGCPVRAPDGQKIGALCAIDRKSREMDMVSLQILRDLAGMIENELRLDQLNRQNSDLSEKLTTAERLAMIDPLTRLWNRAGIMNVFRREWAESLRNETPIGVVMADIDHFKKVNDTYGHAVGDEVLQEMAKRLTASLRIEDAIGRTGGEEFLMLLSNCGQDKLFSTLERIRQEVTAAPVQSEKGPIPVTLSFGGVCAPASNEHDMTDMMKSADDLLYKAKHEGRNRVVV